MSQTKHTPGPWPIAKHYDPPRTYSPMITVGPAVVNFSQGYHPETDPERKARAEADAQLISAAPELLAALKWISQHYANQDMNHVDFRVEAAHRADDAIAKTQGGAACASCHSADCGAECLG